MLLSQNYTRFRLLPGSLNPPDDVPKSSEDAYVSLALLRLLISAIYCRPFSWELFSVWENLSISTWSS